MGLAMYSELLVFSENLKNGPGHLFGGAIKDAKTAGIVSKLTKKAWPLVRGCKKGCKNYGNRCKTVKMDLASYSGLQKNVKPFGAA